MTKRRLVAGVVAQGMGESVDYAFDFKKFVEAYGAPTSEGTCELYDLTQDEEVTDTNLAGSAVLSGTVVTSRIAYNLVEDHEYQLTQAANFAGGRVFSGYVLIRGER